jgi:hypothetical protein
MKEKAVEVVLNIVMRKRSGKLWGYTDQGEAQGSERGT